MLRLYHQKENPRRHLGTRLAFVLVNIAWYTYFSSALWTYVVPFVIVTFFFFFTQRWQSHGTPCRFRWVVVVIDVIVLGAYGDRQFKLRVQLDKKKDDARWKLLVRKVVSAKAMSSLSLPKRKREELQETHNHGIGSFRLHN
jgi:hypothetical protein